MAVIPTKQLLDEFFEEQKKKGRDVRRRRSQLDRPELYAYEQKIGKQLVEFDADDILNMIATFTNKKSKYAYAEEGPKVSANSYRAYISGYKQIFLYYVDVKNYESLRGPYDNPKLKGRNIHVHRAQSRNRLTWSDVENIINQLSSKYEPVKAAYYELIIRLFYDGFAHSDEIANMRESDINFRRREVSVPGRIVKLSERTFQLLLENHRTMQMVSHRTKMDMVSWHGSYMKFFVHPSKAADFESLDIRAIAHKITTPISSIIPKDFGISLNYQRLYLLGFYDYLVYKTSEERVREMVLAERNHSANEEYMELAYTYPIFTESIFHIKQRLVEFL